MGWEATLAGFEADDSQEPVKEQKPAKGSTEPAKIVQMGSKKEITPDIQEITARLIDLKRSAKLAEDEMPKLKQKLIDGFGKGRIYGAAGSVTMRYDGEGKLDLSDPELEAKLKEHEVWTELVERRVDAKKVAALQEKLAAAGLWDEVTTEVVVEEKAMALVTLLPKFKKVFKEKAGTWVMTVKPGVEPKGPAGE